MHQTADRDPIRALGFFVTSAILQIVLLCSFVQHFNTFHTTVTEDAEKLIFTHSRDLSQCLVLALCLDELCELLFGALLPAPCISECKKGLFDIIMM